MVLHSVLGLNISETFTYDILEVVNPFGTREKKFSKMDNFLKCC